MSQRMTDAASPPVDGGLDRGGPPATAATPTPPDGGPGPARE